MDNKYTKYYLSQSGGGMGDIGTLYRINPHFHQVGRGGIGSFFSGVFRFLRPLFKSGVKTIKRQAVKTGVNVINELGKKPFKDILIEQGNEAIDELAKKGVKKLKKLQEGDGIGDPTILHKRHIKRRLPLLKKHSSSNIKKRRFVSRKQKKNKIFRDIFN